MTPDRLSPLSPSQLAARSNNFSIEYILSNSASTNLNLEDQQYQLMQNQLAINNSHQNGQGADQASTAAAAPNVNPDVLAANAYFMAYLILHQQQQQQQQRQLLEHQLSLTHQQQSQLQHTSHHNQQIRNAQSRPAQLFLQQQLLRANESQAASLNLLTDIHLTPPISASLTTALTATNSTTTAPNKSVGGSKIDSGKPAHSYIGLIAMGILSTPDKRMVLSEIYDFIQNNYCYYNGKGSGWRNSVRHNLSLNECFMKCGRAANGKGHYWSIHPANMDDFMRGDFRRRRAQRKVRRYQGLHVPSDESSDESEEDPTRPPLPEHFKRSLQMHRLLSFTNQDSNQASQTPPPPPFLPTGCSSI